jgi:hypothetical protein
MSKPGRVHTREQIHFPHLAKNERDMGHPQLRLGESFNGLLSGKSFDRDDNFVEAGTDATEQLFTLQQNCHPDRSGGTRCFSGGHGAFRRFVPECPSPGQEKLVRN